MASVVCAVKQQQSIMKHEEKFKGDDFGWLVDWLMLMLFIGMLKKFIFIFSHIFWQFFFFIKSILRAQKSDQHVVYKERILVFCINI